jgi:hypothetical protein
MMSLPSHAGDDMSSPPSYADGNAAEATWSWHDVGAEPCERWRCRGDVGRGVMLLPSHTSDVIADDHATVTPGLICI